MKTSVYVLSCRLAASHRCERAWAFSVSLCLPQLSLCRHAAAHLLHNSLVSCIAAALALACVAQVHVLR